MTEKDWLVSETPRDMCCGFPGTMSKRKAILLAIAALKPCAATLSLDDLKEVELLVCLAEQVIEGKGDLLRKRRNICQRLRDIFQEYDDPTSSGIKGYCFNAIRRTIDLLYARPNDIKGVMSNIFYLTHQVAGFNAGGGNTGYGAALASAKLSHVHLLREVFGNPFQLTQIDPAWLAWNEGVVAKIARTIYQEQTFNQLPVLADALEDAGCDEAEILNHLRGPGPHVRGCWALDLVLGKT